MQTWTCICSIWSGRGNETWLHNPPCAAVFSKPLLRDTQSKEDLAQVTFKWWLVETMTIRKKATFFSPNLQLKTKRLFSVYCE